MSALTVADLDHLLAGGCQAPGCDHAHSGPLFLSGRCHQGASVFVEYTAGTLRITCATCHRPVTRIAVAPGASA